jgi:hypothetical protein
MDRGSGRNNAASFAPCHGKNNEESSKPPSLSFRVILVHDSILLFLKSRVLSYIHSSALFSVS